MLNQPSPGPARVGLPRLPKDRRLLQILLTARLSHITTLPPRCVCLQHPSQTSFLAETFGNYSHTSGPVFRPPSGGAKGRFSSHPEGLGAPKAGAGQGAGLSVCRGDREPRAQRGWISFLPLSLY